jgi:hypothetical protein
MDLGLFAGVLWRSRFMVLLGLLVACAAAVFAMARVQVVDGRPQLVYRDPVLYQSNVQLHVTQKGFPDGRSVFNTTPTTLPNGRVDQPTFADPNRFTGLAVLYSQIIMGNQERQRVFGNGKPPVGETILASPMAGPNGSGFLPIIQVTGVAPSPIKAMALADRAASSFSRYLVQRQTQTGVAESDRVILDRIAGPQAPSVYLPRKKLRSIFVFVLVLMLTVAAAFFFENVRNRRAAAAEDGAPAVEPPLGGQAELTLNVQAERSGAGGQAAALARDR